MGEKQAPGALATGDWRGLGGAALLGILTPSWAPCGKNSFALFGWLVYALPGLAQHPLDGQMPDYSRLWKRAPAAAGPESGVHTPLSRYLMLSGQKKSRKERAAASDLLFTAVSAANKARASQMSHSRRQSETQEAG